MPLGVIGIIYESRPNVTADAGALAVKAGNAAILRGGSESLNSALAIHAALVAGLQSAGLPEAAIQLVPTPDRAAVGHMLAGLDGTIDVIVPRGGKSLVERVQKEARVPVFAHLEGLCHTYVDRDADLAMAVNIVLNAKMRRTGVCGATETLLVDTAARRQRPADAGQGAARRRLRGARRCGGAEGRRARQAGDRGRLGDRVSRRHHRREDGRRRRRRHRSHRAATARSTPTPSSRATPRTAERFLREVDSAIVLHNASTQFADGGEFGFGGEIGIATGKLHARGPVGVEQLTSFKYVVRGDGPDPAEVSAAKNGSKPMLRSVTCIALLLAATAILAVPAESGSRAKARNWQCAAREGLHAH